MTDDQDNTAARHGQRQPRCWAPGARPSPTATSPTRSAAPRAPPSSPASTPTTTASSPRTRREAYNSLDGTSTLAVWLRRSGYRTAMVGKYLNGYGVNDGILEPVTDATRDPARLGRVVRAHRRQRPAPLPVQAERERRRPLLRQRPQELRHRRARLARRSTSSSAAPRARSPSSSGSTRPRPTARPATCSAPPATPPPPRATSAATRTRSRPAHPELRRGRRLRQAPVRPGQGRS